MRITSRLTVATHTLLCIEYFKDEYKTTSDFIASSVQVNPVVIRRILLQLKDAGLIEVARGSGGASLKKKPEDITLLDVYRAVDCIEKNGLFHFHENPNMNCPIGSHIHSLLDSRLEEAQNALEQNLSRTTIADLLSEMD